MASREWRRLVGAACRLAADEREPAASTGHLLVALAESDDDVAGFLRTLGSSPAAIRGAVSAAGVSEEARSTRRGRVDRLTGEARAALMDAALRARSPRRVRAEHIFVSLCWGSATVAGDVLRELGVRPGDWETFVSRRGRRAR